jgi:hypothetical protein
MEAKTMVKRLLAGALASAFALTIVALTPRPAQASADGRKNTALLLGGATVYSLAKGKGTQGLILGAGTYYAYKRYQDAHKRETARTRLAAYRSSRAYRPRVTGVRRARRHYGYTRRHR